MIQGIRVASVISFSVLCLFSILCGSVTFLPSTVLGLVCVSVLDLSQLVTIFLHILVLTLKYRFRSVHAHMYCFQTTQIQALEEGSARTCVGGIP